MITTSSLTIQEGRKDRDYLAKNHYNLQVAKAVSTPGGSPKFNVVYASKSLTPNMTVAWSSKYGVNWTTKFPNPGAKVTYTRKWQSCDLGKSYDLTDAGGWEINKNDPHKNEQSVNVGKNGYSMPVHIIVGVLDEQSGSWQTIFVSPDMLPHGGFGQYQPRDHVQLWYGEGMITETIISAQSTAVEEFDMKNIPQQYFWYNVDAEAWQNSSEPFDPPGKSG